jgi:hypothetical protein
VPIRWAGRVLPARARWTAFAAAGVVLVAAAAVAGARLAAAPAPAGPGRPAAPSGSPAWGALTAVPERSGPARSGSAAGLRPVAVDIAAIGVRSTLVPLTLDAAGALQAPGDYVHAGWYVDGPVPGAPGPAVIAGHVDSRAGPAIFFRLRELRPGDKVTVTRSDRSTVRFGVISVERYPKNAFPTGRVYGPTPDRALRLITCGGSFDRARRSYRDNVVVYAVAEE